MNTGKGRTFPNFPIGLKCLDCFHSLFQVFLSTAVWCCFSAEVLRGSGLRRKGGRSLQGLGWPSAAALASASIASF